MKKIEKTNGYYANYKCLYKMGLSLESVAVLSYLLNQKNYHENVLGITEEYIAADKDICEKLNCSSATLKKVIYELIDNELIDAYKEKNFTYIKMNCEL